MNRLVYSSQLMITILLLISNFSSVFPSKGIYFVEERNGQTYSQALSDPQTVNQIGEQIRDLFGLDFEENAKIEKSESEIASSFMQNLYKELEILESGGKSSEDSKIWLNADRIVSNMAIEVSKRYSNGSYRIQFSLKEISAIDPQSILKVQLRIHVDGIISPVYFYFDDKSIERTLITKSHPILVSDVTKLVKKWKQTQMPILRLYSNSENELKIEAFLVIALKDETRPPKRRSRRAVASTPITVPKRSARKSESAYFEKAQANTLCQKKGLYVDFDALGWKQWVIAPEGFSAFYCSGVCTAPFDKSMNVTSHAIVQSLIHLVRPNATEPAKCAPSQLTPMKILFLDQKKNAQIKRYRDMVVQECGCH